MMEKNWWDEWFDEQYALCGTATERERVDAVFKTLATSEMLRGRVAEIIREHERNAGMPGPSLSQAIRQGIAEYLNEPILT